MAEVPLVAGRLINAWELAGARSSAAASRVRGSNLPIFASENLSEGSGINWRGVATAAGIGAITGGFLGFGGVAAARSTRMDIDSAYKRKYPGSSSDFDRSVRRRIDYNMDQLSVAAGNRTTTNRYVNKVKLRSGRIGRKLQKESEEFIQRWQRIYNFGNNSNSYPSTATEQTNPGITVATWATTQTETNSNTGRLMLSHVEDITGQDGWRLLPGYLFDLTCWCNTSNTYEPIPMQRLAFDNVGNARLVPCAQQGNLTTSANSYFSSEKCWVGESGPSGTGAPTSTEQKALLSWSDIRLAIYGAKQRCSKVHVEFIQFKEDKYSMNFHPDGELVSAMTQQDRNDVNLFWLNEFKRLTFNPLVVNTFLRNKALKVLRSETFCINADETTNEDPGPPVVHKQYFKRFNRLVNWAWNTGNLTLTANKEGMDDPDYQVTDQGQLNGYANPHARIYMYIRAEDFEPVTGPTSLYSAVSNDVQSSINVGSWSSAIADINAAATPANSSVCGYDWQTNIMSGTVTAALLPKFCVGAPELWASDKHVSFDIIVRNKWRIQT